jgi:hypothetical protein
VTISPRSLSTANVWVPVRTSHGPTAPAAPSGSRTGMVPGVASPNRAGPWHAAADRRSAPSAEADPSLEAPGPAGR